MAQKNFKVNNGLTTPQTTFLYDDGNIANTRTVNIAPSSSTTANYSLTLPIDDGSSGQVLTTDGGGILTWSSPSGTPTSLVNGNSNVVVNANANVTISSNGQSNIVVVSSDSTNGLVSVIGNVTANNFTTTGSTGNITGANVISANTFKANANVVFLGNNGTSLQQVSIQASSDAGFTSNYTLTLPVDDGSSGQVLTTDGSGILTWSSPSGTPTSIVNGNSNVVVNANANVTISSAGNANVVVVTGSSVYANGAIYANGNINSARILNGSTGMYMDGGYPGYINFFNGTGTTVTIDDNGNLTANKLKTTANGAVVFVSNNGTTTQQVTLQSSTAAGFTSNYSLTLPIDDGTSGQVLTTDGSGILTWSSPSGIPSTIANGNSNVNIPAANGNVNISAVGNANIVVITGTGAIIDGTANITGNANVGSNVTVSQTLYALGNISANSYIITPGGIDLAFLPATQLTRNYGNLDPYTGGYYLGGATRWTGIRANTGDFAANVVAANFVGVFANGNSNVNIPTANGNVNISAVGNANVLVVTGTGANITGTANVSGNANVGNLGTATAIITTGNITTVNTGLVQNGNSNVTITANANVTITSKSNATMVISDTGANITGTANVSGNANVGNLGTAGLIATGNVNFTTSANVSLGAVGNVKITGGSSSQYLQTDGTGNLSWSTVSVSDISNGNSNVNIPAANGNVNISAVGNANILVVTGTGANITGTANVTGNVNFGANIVATGANSIFTADFSSVNVANRLSFVTSNINSNTGVYFIPNGTATAASVQATNNSDPTNASKILIATNGTIDTQLVSGRNGTGTYLPLSLLTSNTVYAQVAANGQFTAFGNVLANLNMTVVGNLTAANVTGSLANGNSNVNIPVANGNVNITAVGNTTLVVTGTGANITGTANITGNLYAGNILGIFANGNSNIGIAANSNITMYAGGNGAWTFATNSNLYVPDSGQIRASTTNGLSIEEYNSNGYLSLATSTTTLQGNTQVTLQLNGGSQFNFSNGLLNAGSANITTNGNITAPVYQYGNSNITITSNANVTITSNSNATMVITSTGSNVTGTGNYTGNLSALNFIGPLAYGNSNVNIPVANANVNISAVGNANVVIVTGTDTIFGSNIKLGNINSNSGIIFNANTFQTKLFPSNALVATYSLYLPTNVASSNGLSLVGNTDGTLSFGAVYVAQPTINFTASTGNNQTFTDANISNFNNSTAYSSVYRNGLLIDNSQYTFAGSTLTVNVDLVSGDSIAVAATNFAAASIVGNGTVGGANTQVQFNDAGNFGGSSSFTYNKSTSILTVPGLVATGNASVSGNANITGIANVTGNIVGGAKLLIGTGSSGLTNPVAVFQGSGATYDQLAMFNSTGTGSADLVTYGNNGDDTQSWTDMGFTGNTFSDANYTVTGAGDGYLFVQGNASFGGNLVIATGNTGTTKDIIFATGGFLTGNIKARLYNANGLFSVTGNISAGNLLGPLANGNSNVNIPTANGNVNITAVGNTTLVITGTGANITGTANVSGNANVGNLGAATAIITTGNITTVNTGLVQNGNSNVAITANANITLTSRSNAVMVITGTGANITGTGNFSGNLSTTNAAIQSSYSVNTTNTAAFMATGSNTNGGTGFFDFLFANNTANSTTGKKTFRIDTNGKFEIINSAYTAALIGVSDAGDLNVKNSIAIGGNVAVNGPAFSAYANNSSQTITSGSQQKVLFQTEEFDTNNNYASSRFTPTVAGYYQLNAEVRLDGASGTGEMMIILYKNGSEYKRGTNQSGTQIASNFWAMQVSSLVYANGTGDYFEIYVQQGSGSSVTVTAVNNTAITWFNGCMVRGA